MAINLNLTQQDYDELLDCIDSENIVLLPVIINKFNISPLHQLLDSPRIGFRDQVIYTYIDYILSYNLTNVLDYFIDDLSLEITDGIIARSLELNTDTYEYLMRIGYTPGIETFKIAVHNCMSGIVESILAIDDELVEQLHDEDIEYLFSFDMDEETVETIQVLFNNNISPHLFTRFLKALKDPEDKYFGVGDEETDIAIEIIELLESYNV
jgi:hypothetical protein